MVRIDPEFTVLVTKISWPLALPIVDGETSAPLGLAYYTDRNERQINYELERAGQVTKLALRIRESQA